MPKWSNYHLTLTNSAASSVMISLDVFCLFKWFDIRLRHFEIPIKMNSITFSDMVTATGIPKTIRLSLGRGIQHGDVILYFNEAWEP